MKKIFCLVVLLMTVGMSAEAIVKPRKRVMESGAVVHEVAENDGQVNGRKKAIGEHSTAPLTSVGSPKIPVILTQFSLLGGQLFYLCLAGEKPGTAVDRAAGK